MGRKSHSIALALPLALAACSSASELTTELVSPPPPNYREIITTRARTVFPDPSAIRETTISAPFIGRSLLGSSSMICVRTNARNEKTGVYAFKVASFTFRNGELVKIDSRFAPTICANAVYEPYPELEEGYEAPPGTPPRRKGSSTR
jgi:hypothetical protein